MFCGLFGLEFEVLAAFVANETQPTMKKLRFPSHKSHFNFK